MAQTFTAAQALARQIHRRTGESAQGRTGKGRSGPAILGGNHDDLEEDCRRGVRGQLVHLFNLPVNQRELRVNGGVDI